MVWADGMTHPHNLKSTKMVRVIKSKISQNKEGKEFVSLKIQGDPEFVQSQNSGKMYLTVRTCYISTTFDEATANALIGKELPGTVERVSSEPYQYTVESTGEVITLAHTYEYKPMPVPAQSVQQAEIIPIDEFAELRAMGFKERA